MAGSLRARLLVAMALVSGVAVAAATLLSARTAEIEIRREAVAEGTADVERIAALLADRYGRDGGWQGAQDLLGRVGPLSHRRLLLVASDGRVVAAWPEVLARAEVEVGPGGQFEFRVEAEGVSEEGRFVGPPAVAVPGAGGETVGTLYAIPDEIGVLTRPSGPRGGRLFAVAAVVLAAALAATWLVSRRVLGPVERLTEAARRMRDGDLSQRVEIDSGGEIGELARSFNAMAEALERAERLRRDMVGDVAHELRTPLTNIRCHVEAIQDGLLAPDAATVASLHEEAMHLSRLVDDLRDLSLADAGMLPVEPEPVDVAAALERARAAAAPRAAAHGISLAVDVAPDLPPALADPVRLGQVLRNLLDNAIASTPEGGRVELSAAGTEGAVEVRVRDTGRGITPEQLERVFDRFYRTDASRARATGGAGLGLAIVRQLVEAHGGRVRAASTPGSGSVFSFTLPEASRRSASESFTKSS